MKRDTRRIEQLLANAREGRQLVREEMASGASLQHVYDELGGHEQIFAQRLKDLQAWNAKQDAPAPAAPHAAEPPPKKRR